jgi:hypothetical protein
VTQNKPGENPIENIDSLWQQLVRPCSAVRGMLLTIARKSCAKAKYYLNFDNDKVV